MNNRRIKNTGALAITIVLIASLIAAIVFWSANRNNLPGPTVATGGPGSILVAQNSGTALAGTVTVINAGADIDATLTAGVLTLNNVRPTATPGAGGGGTINKLEAIPLSINVTPTAMAVHGIPNVEFQTSGNYFLDFQDTYYSPFYLDREINVFQIGFERTGGGGDGDCRVGIYSASGNWQADTLQVDGEIAVSGDAWYWLDVNPTTLSPGSYLTALWCENGLGVGLFQGDIDITGAQEDTAAFSNFQWDWNVNAPTITASNLAFPATGDKWDDFSLSSSGNFAYSLFLKWTVN